MIDPIDGGKLSRRDLLKSMMLLAALGPESLALAHAEPLPIETFVASLSWAPDGKSLAVGYKKHSAAIIEPISCRVLTELFPKPLAPLDMRISVNADVNMARTNWYPVSISPDGKLIAVNHYLTVYVLETATGKLVQSRTSERGKDFNPFRAEHPLLPGKKIITQDGWREIMSYVAGFSWSADSKRLAIADANGVHIFDIRSGKDVYTYQGMPHQVYSTSWSKDGKWLAAISFNFAEKFKSLHIWNAASGVTHVELKGIKHLTFSPDSRYLAYDQYKGIVVYDLAKKWARNIIATKDEFPTFFWSPNGKYLAVSDTNDAVVLHDAATGAVKTSYRASLKNSKFEDVFPSVFAWSPDGKRLAIGREEYTVKFWNPQL